MHNGQPKNSQEKNMGGREAMDLLRMLKVVISKE
jgi:hypothetical protein